MFQQVVDKMLKERSAKEGDLCLTTYFDNDDCLHKDYIKTIHDWLQNDDKISLEDGFLVFDYGIQYFTELGIATRVKYPNNHFMTLFEKVSSAKSPSTCYGYGSHIDVEKRKAAPVHHIADAERSMWVEVIHKDNVDNDVMMRLDNCFIKDKQLLRTDFSLDIDLQNGKKMKYFKRYLKHAFRRLHERLSPKKW